MGYLEWSTTAAENALQEPPVIAGVQQTTVRAKPSGQLAGGGVRIPRLDGTFLKHFSPAHPNMPLPGGVPQTLSFETGEYNAIDDWRHHIQISAQSVVDDLEVLLRLETSDQWVIETGRTSWTPSFKMGFGTAIAASLSALPTPVVQVLDSANVVQKTLTVVSGAPSAGEVQIDQTTDSRLLTTAAADLDGDAGDRLVVWYVPLLPVSVEPIAFDRPELNILTAALSLPVAPPDADWASDTA